MQRGVAQRERAALADAEQVDRIQRRARRAYRIDAAIEVTVDVIVERQPAIGAIGITPVDQVDVLALLEQVAHHRAVGLQVDHVRPVDQRVDDQQRGLRGRLATAGEMPHLQLVFAVDQLARRVRVLGLAHAAQMSHAGGELALERGDVAQRPGRVDAQWRLHGGSPYLRLRGLELGLDATALACRFRRRLLLCDNRRLGRRQPPRQVPRRATGQLAFHRGQFAAQRHDLVGMIGWMHRPGWRETHGAGPAAVRRGSTLRCASARPAAGRAVRSAVAATGARASAC